MSKLKSDISAPWHMWVVGGLLLLFNGLGAFDYVMSVIRYEPYLAKVPEETLSYYFNAPLWMYAMWGIGSFGGLISAVLLLMRRGAAVPVMGIAWVCSVIAAVTLPLASYAYVKSSAIAPPGLAVRICSGCKRAGR